LARVIGSVTGDAQRQRWRMEGFVTMKHKWLVIVSALMIALVLTVVACGGEEKTTTTAAPTETTAAPTETTAAPTETTAAPQTTAPSGGVEAKILRLAAVDNEAGYAGEATKTFAAELEKRTEGRYKVEIGWACSYGPPGEFFDQVTSGLIDFAYFLPVTMPGAFPESDICALPWVLPNAGIATQAIQKLVEQGYSMDEGMSAVKFLNVHMGPGHVLMTPKEVSSIADFAGMKIIVGGEPQAAAVTAMGATPVSFDQADYYSSLQKGVADALYNPWIGMAPWKLQEVVKNVMETNIANVMCAWIMNWDTYNGMSAADQKVVDDLSQEIWTSMIVQGYDNVTATSKELLAAQGGKVLQMTPEEYASLDTAFASIWTDWIAAMEAKGLPGKEACDAMYGILKDLGVDPPAIGYAP